MRSFPFLLATAVAGWIGCLSYPVAAVAQQCGDVNCSGGVTSSDALAVLRRAVGLGVVLVCASDCSTTTTSAPPTTTTSTTTTTTTTTTTLPQDLPCQCAAPCPFLCPDKTVVEGKCVMARLGLNPGECLCTALCPSLPPLCEAGCDLAPCSLPCPGGASVPGFCDAQSPVGCLCSNLDAQPCP